MIDFSSLSALLKAVADPVRLRILQLLCHEELAVGELVRILELPQSSVSRQLKALKARGLVADRPVGAATYYRANLEAELGNSETQLRDALDELLRRERLAPADAKRLARVLALREAEGEGFFDRVGLRWDALREHCFGPTFHLEALVRLLPHSWVAADLGAGTGYLLPLLGAHFRRVVAVDESRQMLALARRRVKEAGLKNVELRHGTLESLPLKTREVDLALALLLLHHLDDIEDVLRRIQRSLRPGGRLLIVEIHPHQNERFRATMADRRSGIDPGQLVQWLTAAGFNSNEISHWDYPCTDHPEHDLAPLPRLYGIIANK